MHHLRPHPRYPWISIQHMLKVRKGSAMSLDNTSKGIRDVLNTETITKAVTLSIQDQKKISEQATAIRANQHNTSVDAERRVRVCKSKVKYHTEKSAIRAAKALSVGFNTEFIHYRCGESKHFHLTHKIPAKRIGHGNRESF